MPKAEALLNFIEIDLKLRIWKERWDFEGEHLVCSRCRVRQRTRQVREGFRHEAVCPNDRGGRQSALA